VIRITVADRPELLDALFRVRHQVFAGGGYMPATASGRIVSHLDALPTCVHLTALVDGAVVGGIRVDHPGGVPSGADELFDFDPYVSDPSTAAGVSLLCVLPEHRGLRGINRSLWKMASYVAENNGMTHIKGSANPERRSMFEAMGYEVLVETFHHDESGLDVLPVLLELTRANRTIREFLARQELGPFRESFDRLFVSAGETIVRQGDHGDEAYVLVAGEAVVETSGGRSFPLGPGELFGELALLTDRQRTASVVARTDVELMALDRRRFQAELDARPATAIVVLRALASRLAAAISDERPVASTV